MRHQKVSRAPKKLRRGFWNFISQRNAWILVNPTNSAFHTPQTVLLRMLRWTVWHNSEGKGIVTLDSYTFFDFSDASYLMIRCSIFEFRKLFLKTIIIFSVCSTQINRYYGLP